MRIVDNQSYNRIIKFLNNEEDLSENDRRYLIYYATQLYKANIENIEDEKVQDIYDALRELSASLIGCVDNSLTIKRINDIVVILQKLSSNNLDSKTFSEVSYEVDKLYCAVDLPIRKNSSLSYNLMKYGRKK